MIKVTQKALKIYFIGLTMLTISSLAMFLYLNSVEENETTVINEFRVLIHPMYRELREMPEDYVNQGYKDYVTSLNIDQDYLDMTIVDLSGKIIVTTKEAVSTETITTQGLEGEPLFLDEQLFVDQSYSMNEKYMKLAMPVYRDEKVNGFAIFEIQKEYLNAMSSWKDQQWKMQLKNIAMMIIMISTCLFINLLWFILYKFKNTSLDLLKLRIENISKGILEPIEIHSRLEHKDLFVKYNNLIDELSYMLEQQSNYENKRKDFLTSISHELKTPLATINAYIEGLMSPMASDEETRERYQKIIAEKMKQLMIQVDELFKYAQEKSGRFKYNFEECYADQVFGQLFEVFLSHKDMKTVVVNQVPKCIVNMDRIRIEQVLMNLYNNAKKHSNTNNIITIRGYRQDSEIVIEVEDQGEGIVPKDMPYIFDTYYQGENSNKKDYEGVGLGLSICKDILMHHQGSIKVKSVVGEGSVFTIFIPIV